MENSQNNADKRICSTPKNVNEQRIYCKDGFLCHKCPKEIVQKKSDWWGIEDGYAFCFLCNMRFPMLVVQKFMWPHPPRTIAVIKATAEEVEIIKKYVII